MKQLTCEVCGGKLVMQSGGIAKCDSCGMEYTKERIQEKVQEIKGTVKIDGPVETIKGNSEKERLLKNAEQFEQFQDWEKAYQTYKEITKEFPNEYIGWYKLFELETLRFNGRKFSSLSGLGIAQQRIEESKKGESLFSDLGWFSGSPSYAKFVPVGNNVLLDKIFEAFNNNSVNDLKNEIIEQKLKKLKSNPNYIKAKTLNAALTKEKMAQFFNNNPFELEIDAFIESHNKLIKNLSIENRYYNFNTNNDVNFCMQFRKTSDGSLNFVIEKNIGVAVYDLNLVQNKYFNVELRTFKSLDGGDKSRKKSNESYFKSFEPNIVPCFEIPQGLVCYIKGFDKTGYYVFNNDNPNKTVIEDLINRKKKSFRWF